MDNLPLLEAGNYYHIYNRANGKENLFWEDSNYRHFLKLYAKYIPPIADTLAWVLMPNHFHILVWIKEGMYYKYSPGDFISSNADNSPSFEGKIVRFEDVKWETTPSPSSGNSDDLTIKHKKRPVPHRHLSHLFNAYTKYINEKYGRHGNLFQRPFKRKLVDTENYLKKVLLYIHNNPVHHSFVNDVEDYPWSSYHTFLSTKPSRLKREKVMEWFEGSFDFKTLHKAKINHLEIEQWLEI